jgi:polyhydroxybutyrate depolymerase
MKRTHRTLLVALLNYCCLLTVILTELNGLSAAEPELRKWSVNGIEREALVYIPKTSDQPRDSAPIPLVFVFHGHGGHSQHATRSFHLHQLWPEAIVVYPQGLLTPGRLTDTEGKRTGWQRFSGDQGNRDLVFFDHVLASIRRDLRIDETRIYATGHSNGGAFSYLLAAERSAVLAAIAPSGAAAIRLKRTLLPLPVFHIAGENDPLVKYKWQRETIDMILKINRCDSGAAWKNGATIHHSEIGMPVAVLITQEGHHFPPRAPELIVEFLKQQSRKADPATSR